MLPFGYAEPHAADDAVRVLVGTPGAMAIAGGTDMLQLLREAVLAPSVLVDLNALPLRGVEADGGGLRIGALTRLADVADDPRVREGFPVLAQALDETASVQVRNMATMGGNLLQRTRCLYFRDVSVPCNKRAPGSGCPAWDGQNRMNAILGGSRPCIAAYPGDLAAALLVLDAQLELIGPRGERRIELAALHREPGDTPEIETTLEPGELIAAIRVPASGQAKLSRYVKVRDRATFEWALVGVAAALEVADGTVRTARVATTGVGTRPWRLPAAEKELVGRTLDDAACVTAGEAATRGAVPRPGNEFKVVLLQRAVEQAVRLAGGLG